MSAAATLVQVPYGGDVADHRMDVWPTAGYALIDELRAARGRVAVISATTLTGADDLVWRLSTDLGVDIVRLGLALADRPKPPSIAEIEAACGDATVVTDLDALLWPELHVSPLQLLYLLARRRPTIAVWPGEISGVRASYSVPGRPDHQDIGLRDAVVLRPCTTRFPDEVPFTIERILP